jgi:hypothetical protein
MANIAFSTPFTKSFVHTNATVGTTASEILAKTTNSHDKRVLLLIQNQHATNTIQVVLAETGASGIILSPFQSLSLENYNGAVRAVASGANTAVHIAYSLV